MYGNLWEHIGKCCGIFLSSTENKFGARQKTLKQTADGMAYGPGVLSTHCRNLTSWDHIRQERFESTNLFVLKTIQFLRVSKFHPIY